MGTRRPLEFKKGAVCRIDVAALPQREQQAGVLHSDGYCMPASVKDKDATWAFIEYAVGPAGQEILARTGRTVPSMKSVAE